ncbi:MAG: M14 family metallopeptidase [Gemmatimonadales bacterium]
MRRCIERLLTGAAIAGGALSSHAAAAQVPVDWAMHHDHEEVTRLVRAWADEYPNLVTLESLGTSVQGRDLWLLTVTNRDAGPAPDKPALWIDGHSDGGEVLCKEVALYLIGYLLDNHRTDRVARILERVTLYIEPDANPDPGEQVIQPPEPGVFQGVSRTGYLYPWDGDGDGVSDEDPPEDVNGDGLVVSMRVRDPNGEWKLHPEDSRLVVRREAGDGPEAGPFYRFYPTEGIDNDGDGRINEDWLGGFDSNRMYPVNWRMEWRQKGAPPYPLFTPEPKAIVDAVLARPNIGALISLHTSGVFPGGTLWQAPASQFPDEFLSYDVRFLYPTFGRVYERVMRREGYPYSRATAANVREREPRGEIPATLIDWAFINYGMLAWTPEIWARGVFDYDGDESISPLETMRWNEEEWNGRLFVSWREAQHPTLGTVEVGGWRNDFDAHGLTPPEGFVYRSEQILPWFLFVLESLPRVVVRDMRSDQIEDGVYRVTTMIGNNGFLDTPVTERAASLAAERNVETGESSFVQLVPGGLADITGEDGTVVGNSRREVGHLKGWNAGDRFRSEVSRDWPRKVQVSWVVQGGPGTRVTVRAGTPRAGFAERTIQLGGR